MGDPTGIVNDCVGRCVGYVESTLGRQVGYLIHYKRNLQHLQTHVDELSVARDTMREMVNEAEAKGEIIHSAVMHWLTIVAEITKEAEEILKGEQQSTTEEAKGSSKDERQPKMKCVQGFCPNPMLRRHRNKKSLALVEEVIKLINEERQLANISFAPPKNLQTEVEKLSVAKAMDEKVNAAYAKGEKIHANVQNWLKNVDEITKEIEEFLKDEIQATQEPYDSLSHPSKESLELLQVVTELYEMREFSDISYAISYAPPKDLQTEVEKLSVAKATVDEKVNAARAKGEKIHANVQDWLKKVDEITKEIEEFLKDEIQATQEPYDSSSHPSKESLELLQVVTELCEMREFSDISYVGQASAQDYQEINSRDSTLEKIVDELRRPNSTDIILVHGIGGVGKTTLAEEVQRQAEKEKLFDDLVMVRDVKKPNLEAIQKIIADKLGLNLSKIQTIAERADRICDRIKEKKILVILDDVWEQIDFKAVGLPHISTCRILLTSRTSKLFSVDKINQKPFQLGVLGEEETWLLFEKIAGNVVEDLHIRIIATQLAKKCGGLPVLVVTVASSLRNETSLSVWRNSLRSLEKFDEEEELTEKAYLVIEWTYTQLNEHLKLLFLLCGTIVEGDSISLTTLLKYSMGLGFFKRTKTVKEARDALDTQVGKLKASCLLVDGDDDTCVRMHELVHLVNHIASRDHHVLVQDRADDELKEWTAEDLSRCSKISLHCCNIATLPKVPWECPKLEMFHLHSKDEDDDEDNDEDDDEDEDDDSSRDMPSNFFEEMKNLKVLGLNNLPPMSLPPSLKSLENLQTLCLDGCMFEDIALVGELRNLQILSIVKSKVKQLPKEIGQLTSLRLLDLCDCSLLKVISPGVISNLTRLEDLRMRNSFDKWEGEGVICETSNASLLELMNLSKLTAIEICIPDANILPPNLFSNKLERYQIFVGDAWKWNCMYETTLNTLKLQLTTSNELDRGLTMLLEKCDVLSLDGTKGFDFTYIINMKVMLPNLSSLVVHRCNSLRFMLSSSTARSLIQLKHLEITECQMMEEIVSTEQYGEEITGNMFPQLQHLKLKGLPNLAKFCSASYIEFPSLKILQLKKCAKLETFISHPLTKNFATDNEIEEEDCKENPETVVTYFLFDKKVGFPRLERLSINGLTKLITIWHNQLDPYSFCGLRDVKVRQCNGLISMLVCQVPEEIISEIKHSQENPNGIFSEIEQLELDGLPNLTRFCSGSYMELSSLKILKVVECAKLKKFIFDPLNKRIAICKEIEGGELKENLQTIVQHFIFDVEKVVLPNLTSLIVHQLDGLSFLLSSSMARSIVQFRYREISEGQIMELIVSARGYGEENLDDMFSKLELLEQNDLHSLDKFGSIQRWNMVECIKLESVFDPVSENISIYKEMKETHSEENLESVVHSFLFDEKVVLCNITRLVIHRCHGLSFLLSSDIARTLVQLKHVEISECQIMKEIVFLEECSEANIDDMLPKLEQLVLKDLPNLTSFCSRIAFNWPLLKTLELFHCRIVNIFASGFSGLPKTPDLGDPHNPIKQPSVLIEKSSFPNLEDLTLGPMDIWYGPPAPAAIYKQAVFPGISSRHTDKIIPHLKTLRLHGMEKLMRLWEENTEPAGPVFLQLETLEVKFYGLNNIELSAISFKNLTNLEVSFCWRLQYLTTYSVAQSLGQLKKLKVDECKSMKEILANDGVGEDASIPEIVFSQLQHLELSDLISLEWFCSRNCTVKVPLLETSALVVNWCSLKLKISSNKTLEEVDSNMHLNVQKSHPRKEEAKNLQEAELHSQIRQLEKLSRANEAEMRHLQELLRAKEAEMRDKEQKLADRKRDLQQLILKDDEFNAREARDEGLLDILESEQGQELKL